MYGVHCLWEHFEGGIVCLVMSGRVLFQTMIMMVKEALCMALGSWSYLAAVSKHAW